MAEVWKISIKAFDKAKVHNPAKVFQFVLMSNHYYLLIQTPKNDIDKFMFGLIALLAKDLEKKRTEKIVCLELNTTGR